MYVKGLSQKMLSVAVLFPSQMFLCLVIPSQVPSEVVIHLAALFY